LNEALTLATLSGDERARIDISMPFSTWPDADAIIGRLTNNYARLLDTQVAGEVSDYLLWNGVDIALTFADPSKEPDVEHLCLALLVLEGVATDLATANWDGLIEKAADELTGGLPCLVAFIRRENLQEPAQKAWLYKFHGCAVRAVANEADYRPFLIGRASQINGWATRAEHVALVTKLVGVIISKPTLMMGLSVQDANIQALFAAAEAQSPWSWPGDRPSFVFSGDRIGADQQGMLQNVYRADLTPVNRQQIIDSAVIQAYAKPLLIALVLYILCAKLRRLVDLAPGNLTSADRAKLQSGLMTVRDSIAAAGDGDRLAFVRALVDQSSRIISLYRDGHAGTMARSYNPLTTTPLHRIGADSSIPASGLRELAVAIGILGVGARDGLWTLTAANPGDPTSGVVAVRSSLAAVKVVLVANSHTALRLRHNGHLSDGEDAIVIHGAEIVPPMSRSPRSAPGRTGEIGLRQISISDLLRETANSDDLVQRFREGVAI